MHNSLKGLEPWERGEIKNPFMLTPGSIDAFYTERQNDRKGKSKTK